MYRRISVSYFASCNQCHISCYTVLIRHLDIFNYNLNLKVTIHAHVPEIVLAAPVHRAILEALVHCAVLGPLMHRAILGAPVHCAVLGDQCIMLF
jgi:hypothetical protein